MIKTHTSARVNVETTRLVALLSIVLAVAVALGYMFGFGLEKLLEHLLPEVLLAAVLFPSAYFVFWRRGILIGEGHSVMTIVSSDYVREFFLRHDAVDWPSVIEAAKEIDIVVFYYDKWVRANHDSFVKFFRDGGKASLVMSDPADAALLAVIQKYFFPTKSADELARQITATESALIDAHNESGQGNAELHLFHFKGVLHYSFVLIDKRQLYLSVYEQFRGPTVRSSVFRIDLTADRELEKYWLANLEGFKKNSSRPSPWRRAA